MEGGAVVWYPLLRGCVHGTDDDATSLRLRRRLQASRCRLVTMLALSLRDWIAGAELGPLKIGATQAELRAALGRPDAAGCPDEGVDMVWKYGDIELLFEPSRPARVWCVEMHAFSGAPTGGSRICLDPWIVRTGLPLGELRRGLEKIGVGFREEVAKTDPWSLLVIVRESPRLHFDVITAHGDWPIGLHGVWLTRV